jgi:CTD small phosphatase-like protein 2
LVDNSVYSFAYQVENGVPIISFYDDPKDEELKHLMCYLTTLANCQDVRVENQKAFELDKIGLDVQPDEQMIVEEKKQQSVV